MKGTMLGVALMALMAGCSVNYAPEVKDAVYTLEREHQCFVVTPATYRAEFRDTFGHILADQAESKLKVSSASYIDLSYKQRQEEFKGAIMALYNGNPCR